MIGCHNIRSRARAISLPLGIEASGRQCTLLRCCVILSAQEKGAFDLSYRFAGLLLGCGQKVAGEELRYLVKKNYLYVDRQGGKIDGENVASRYTLNIYEEETMPTVPNSRLVNNHEPIKKEAEVTTVKKSKKSKESSDYTTKRIRIANDLHTQMKKWDARVDWSKVFAAALKTVLTDLEDDKNVPQQYAKTVSVRRQKRLDAEECRRLQEENDAKDEIITSKDEVIAGLRRRLSEK